MIVEVYIGQCYWSPLHFAIAGKRTHTNTGQNTPVNRATPPKLKTVTNHPQTTFFLYRWTTFRGSSIHERVINWLGILAPCQHFPVHPPGFSVRSPAPKADANPHAAAGAVRGAARPREDPERAVLEAVESMHKNPRKQAPHCLPQVAD